MTIRQLELFACVYELRSLTRTAETLYMTQSAVTQNLKRIEEELGARLFERSNRCVEPTHAGDSFYRHATRIVAEYRRSLADLTALEEELKFCYYDTPSSTIKDMVISAFWAIDPHLKIDQLDCRISELLDNRWAPGTVYLVPEEFVRDPSIQTIEAATVQHWIMMQENHRLHAKSRIKPEDLEGETIFLRSNPDMHFSHLTRSLNKLSERGIHYKTAVAEQERELAPRILSFGGIAIIPEYLVRDVPGIITRPYDDGIDIHVKLAYKGALTPRVMKLLSAFQKKRN